MREQVSILQRLVRGGIRDLDPAPHATAAVGHGYPALNELDIAPDALPALLGGLADLGCLSRRLVDRIHTCPACGRWEINFREVCPTCRSVDHRLHEVLHHFPCAYAGPRIRFERPGGLVCPKCERALLQIGIDYDRPGQLRVCTACAETFDEAEVECRCLSCRNLFPVDKAQAVPLHAYRLTPKGILAAETGDLDFADFRLLVEDSELGIFTFSYMCHRIDQEIARAARYERPLAIGLVQLASGPWLEEAATPGSPTVLGRLAREAARRVRPCDLLGRFDRRTLLYVLPETGPEQAEGALRRVCATLADVLRDAGAPELTHGMAAYPARADREALLMAAAENLVGRAPGGLAWAG